MRIHKNVFELIGNTPLVELTNYENNHGLGARLIGEVEYFEPAGSIKDRIAKAMIDEAEANGLLDADTVIIEPTSGNTGIGLAAIAAARGNRIIIVMPDTMSVERRKLMRAYGAELVLTPVSYTHLDVYKRQTDGCRRLQRRHDAHLLLLHGIRLRCHHGDLSHGNRKLLRCRRVFQEPGRGHIRHHDHRLGSRCV